MKRCSNYLFALVLSLATTRFCVAVVASRQLVRPLRDLGQGRRSLSGISGGRRIGAGCDHAATKLRPEWGALDAQNTELGLARRRPAPFISFVAPTIQGSPRDRGAPQASQRRTFVPDAGLPPFAPRWHLQRLSSSSGPI